MATKIYSSTRDGFQASGLQGTHDAAHDLASGGQNVDINDTSTTVFGPGASYAAARSAYYFVRCFFDFDTSGITSTVASCTFNLRTQTNNAATPCIVLKSGHNPAAHTSNDWYWEWLEQLGGSVSGWGPSSTGVTAYSAATAVASNGNFTTYTLNAAALSDLVSLSTFKIVVMEHDHDYQDSTPTVDNLRNGIYWADYSGTTSDPYIEYTLDGYANNVSGVVTANIGKINGVATGNIGKVNGI